MKKKNILVICNYFAPDNTIAAVRVTKLAKYFYNHNYEVTVIAEQRIDAIEDDILRKDAEGIKVIRIENSKKMKDFFSLYQRMISNVKKKRYDDLDNRMKINRKTGKYEFNLFQTAHPVIGSLDFLIELLRQFDLFKMSKRFLDKNTDVDYVFTSFGNFLGIFAGAYLHNRDKNIFWIFDLRDPICDYKWTPQYMKWLTVLSEKYIWKRADCITAVSKGICRHVPRRYRDKLHYVTNGYDRKDREGIIIDDRPHDKLRFAYTGGLYGGMRNLSPLFSSIRTLVQEKKIDNSKIEFCYAGKESAYEIFKSQAKKYELNNNCVYYGKIPRKEALKLQMESDILVVCTADYQTDVGGMITGKALEYMSADKPIIAIINGDIGHSELGEIIRSAKLGCVYEEAHYKKDYENMCLYLLEKYKEFLEKGKPEHNPEERILKKFDYQYLGKRMLRIIESI